jgi:hypothetical protein
LNKNIEPGAMPWLHRYIGTPLMTKLINWLYNTKINDCNCGMRSFHKNTFNKLNLKSSGWEIASEMIIKATLNKFTIKEVVITLHKSHSSRKPHLNPWLAAIKNIYLIFCLVPKQLKNIFTMK